MIPNNYKKSIHLILEVTFIILLLSLHFYFKLFHANLSVQGDEVYSIFHSQKDLHSFITFLLHDESPLTFYLILNGWIQLFGINLISVKALPVLFSAGSAVVIYFFAKKKSGLLGAVIASLLFLFSNLHFDFSHEVRAYSLVSFLTITSFYLFFELLDNPRSNLKLVLYTLCTALLPYSHYNSVYVPLVQFILLTLLHYREIPDYKRIYISYLVAFCLFIPQLYFLQDVMPGENFWLDYPDYNVFEYVLRMLSGNQAWSVELYSFLLIATTIAFSPLRTYVYRPDFKVKEYLIFTSWFILPILLNYLIAQFTPIFRLRYVLYSGIGFFFCISYAIAHLRIHLILRWVIGLLIVYTFIIHFSPHSRNVEDWKNVAEIIHKEKGEKTAVIICAAYMYVNFTYYYDQEAFKNYQNTTALLEEQDIFLVNNIEQLKAIKKLNTYNRILLVLSHEQVVDPQGLILSYFENSQLHYCEKYGDEKSAKVVEYANREVPCKREMILQKEESTYINCYKWLNSYYKSEDETTVYYHLITEKDSTCANSDKKENYNIVIGPNSPYSPSVSDTTAGIKKVFVEAWFEKTDYKDAKFIVSLDKTDRSALMEINPSNLRRDEYPLQTIAVPNSADELYVQFSINIKEEYQKENCKMIIYLWNYGGGNVYLKEMNIGITRVSD